jgi:ABC-type antimicrobial peptide transport system permease subunit
MFAYQQKIIRNQLFLITTIALLFHVGFSLNNATYGQQVVDNTNRTVSLDPAPENDAVVVIPAPSADDFSPETEQQAGTKEKVLENSDESNDNGAPGTVEQADIQKDKVSKSDQTTEDRQAQVSEDDSDAREDVNDNDNDNVNDNGNDDDDDDDDDDVPFDLPFP